MQQINFSTGAEYWEPYIGEFTRITISMQDHLNRKTKKPTMTKYKLNQKVLYPGINIDYEWELTPNEWVDKIGIKHYEKIMGEGWFTEVIETPKHPMYFIGDTQVYTKEDVLDYNNSHQFSWGDWHKERYGK